ncbi:MAG: AAA family ATPase [Solirubrobacteraceae bacterium]
MRRSRRARRLVTPTIWRGRPWRPVEEQPLDPQLHSHVLLHGAVRRDGRIVAIDSRSWLVHRREIGAAYRTELARELATLGFRIERGTGHGGRYFEIAGVPQALLDRWSSRRHQVQAAVTGRLREHQAELVALVATGGPDAQQASERLELLLHYRQLAPREERSLSTQTRTAKTQLTRADLDANWHTTAGERGLSRDTVDQLRAPTPTILAGPPIPSMVAGLTEFDAAFPARDARAVALEQAAGVPIDQALDALRGLREDGEILHLADGTGTTREHRAREHATVTSARQLAAHTTTPIPNEGVRAQAERLDRELRARGGRLSHEQRHAIALACGERRLVMIEGQAGTGKSTTLIGIARAHHDAGRELIVTSTAALAAERLARELQEAGVTTRAYSLAGLQGAIRTGAVTLDRGTTIIHDEAALASTREQHALLEVVETSGARLIEIGDPHQNPPVGAGGLWPHLEAATQASGARATLTRNQRAQDPADRRDQARFRSGRHEAAVRGYAARRRIHHATDLTGAEDAALDAAHNDHQNRLRTIVIAQTSNEHLDELNARYQAIRHQHGELGQDAIAVPGRPYELRRGDAVQVRHTIHHPEYGQLRNGTSADIRAVDPRAQTVDLALSGGQRVTINQKQIDRAQLRLAYVQHPFPAQGQTTDTAHLIVSQHATREGTYVALTRARNKTHLYANEPENHDVDINRLSVLAERISRTEPDLPSIHTPIAHEHAIATSPDRSARTIEQSQPVGWQPSPEQTNHGARGRTQDATDAASEEPGRDGHVRAPRDMLPHSDDTDATDADPRRPNGIERDRRWPHQDRSALDRDDDRSMRPHVPNRDRSEGWEP